MPSSSTAFYVAEDSDVADVVDAEPVPARTAADPLQVIGTSAPFTAGSKSAAKQQQRVKANPRTGFGAQLAATDRKPASKAATASLEAASEPDFGCPFCDAPTVRTAFHEHLQVCTGLSASKSKGKARLASQATAHMQSIESEHQSQPLHWQLPVQIEMANEQQHRRTVSTIAKALFV
jgi:hypothetical protein